MIQLIAGYKAFHSEFSKTKFEVQDLISSFSFNFIHPNGAEMNKEYRETNGARNGCVYKENLEIDREHVLCREERFLKKTKLILDRWIEVFIAINGCDDPLFHKSLPSNVIRPIADGR